jgi:hypothetical protein
MKESSEKYEDIDQYELEALREIKKNLFERDEENAEHVDLVKGTACGLVFGIGGSLFALSLYPVVEALLRGESTVAFVGNLIVGAVCLILIAFVSLYLHRQFSRDKNKPRLSRESVEVIEYAIKRRQHTLEQREKEKQQPNVSQSHGTGNT